MSSVKMITNIKIILFMTLLWLHIQGEIIGEVNGEIKPVSVSMTKEQGSSYAVSNAIDRNTDTPAYSQGSDSWFKAKLDRQYCIEEVRHWYGSNLQTHTCSRDACTCSGSSTYCRLWPVSVYTEDGTAPDNAASDCKIGDTVKFDGSVAGGTRVSELVIIGRAPVCSAPIIEKGTVIPDSEIYSGATFSVSCDNGFVISGSSTITCTNGELSVSPTCVPVATVTCDEKEMKLTLAEKGSFETIRLNEKDCEFPGEVQEIKTDLEKCGTRAYFNSTHVIYKNEITGVAKTTDHTNGITRDFKLAFECSYSRTGATEYASWQVKGITVVDAGSLRFVLDLYKDETFADKVDKFPFELYLNEDIYMQVTLDSLDPDLSLGVLNVQATNSESEDEAEGNLSYDLVKEGCIKDSTFRYIDTDSNSQPLSDPKVKRFTFKSFNFLESTIAIYIHAVVKVCSVSNSSFGCTDLCSNGRRKRSVDGKSELNDERFHVYQGPMVARDPIETKAKVESGFGVNMKLGSEIWTVLLLLHLLF